jgi:hypothetical protein
MSHTKGMHGSTRDPRTGAGAAHVIAEWTRSRAVAGLSEPPLGACPCMRAHRVELTAQYTSLDGSRGVAVFRAPDAESVRMALAHTTPAGFAWLRIWATRPRTPAGM